MMEDLKQWLIDNKISFQFIDNEVVHIEDFGDMYMATMDHAKSIFKGKDDDIQFNLMENPEILMGEEIFYVAFKFGDNWYYYDLREEFQFKILKYIGKPHECKSKTEFVNLGVHTPYELLNGSGSIDLWVKKAVYLGHKAIGICDKNTMAATLILQKECKNAGIKHVFGYSFQMRSEDGPVDMKIYCKTQEGMRNLLRIQKAIMVDSEDNMISKNELLTYAKGNFLVFGKKSSKWLVNNKYRIDDFKQAFFKCYYQVDVSEYKAERIDVEILECTKLYFDNYPCQIGIDPILICDTYYLDKSDARNKILLNKVATGAAHEQSDDQYFKDIDEHYERFFALVGPDKRDEMEIIWDMMCRSTIFIADSSEACYDLSRNYMPQYDMTEEEKEKYGDRHNMFIQILEEGFKKLVPKGMEEQYRKQLNYEIYVLESTDNVDYMLVQYDTVNWARSQDILVGVGRGSAGGSLVLYLLGITMIDPIKYGLIFERFLLPERAGLYPGEVTKIYGNIESDNYYQVTINGKTFNFDIDAKFLVKRGEESISVYADELAAGDDIIFDNRDLIWEMK